MFDLIGFDADDTLWHNETLYVSSQDELCRLLSPYAGRDCVLEMLYETETKNLEWYGYGVKSFALSMIEVAVALSSGQITGVEIGRIVALGRAMLEAEVELLDHVSETICALSASYSLMVITKGDLRDQQSKLERSAIDHWFSWVEILSDKSTAAYQAILARHGVDPARFLMVGNSLRSDVVPVLGIGGHAVYIPYTATWAHETLDGGISDDKRFYQLAEISGLPALISQIVQVGLG